MFSWTFWRSTIWGEVNHWLSCYHGSCQWVGHIRQKVNILSLKFALKQKNRQQKDVSDHTLCNFSFFRTLWSPCDSILSMLTSLHLWSFWTEVSLSSSASSPFSMSPLTSRPSNDVPASPLFLQQLCLKSLSCVCSRTECFITWTVKSKSGITLTLSPLLSQLPQLSVTLHTSPSSVCPHSSSQLPFTHLFHPLLTSLCLSPLGSIQSCLRETSWWLDISPANWFMEQKAQQCLVYTVRLCCGNCVCGESALSPLFKLKQDLNTGNGVSMFPPTNSTV